MDIRPTSRDDLLAPPVRRRLFESLAELRRPATTKELAQRVGRHPNTVRLQLQLLTDAGLLERRTVRLTRGRPRDEWTIAAGARPGGDPPEALGQLARWLARALSRPNGLDSVERVGEEIGRELAPAAAHRSGAEAMQDALSALGFAPRPERPAPDVVRYVLRNCPYRDAVRENQAAICALHRGITNGLRERLAPGAELAAFVPKDPYAAGCLIELIQVESRP